MPGLTQPRRRHALFVAALLALLALLAACGGDDGDAVADGAFKKDKAVPTLSIPPPATTLPDAKGKPCKPATDVPSAEGKPEVKMPEGTPPAKLETEDLKVGDGAEAKLGDTVKVNYVGIACSTGTQFDSSWDRGEPVEFALAEGQLIKGWTDGIPGMKVGGRRQLVIPSDLGYGPDGTNGIGPNEALVFVVDLVGVTPAGQATTTAPPASAP